MGVGIFMWFKICKFTELLVTKILQQKLKLQIANSKIFISYIIIILRYFRVLITAVSTKFNPPVLHFFNNCFDNKFSDGKYPTNSLLPLYDIDRTGMESSTIHECWTNLFLRV